MNSDSFISFAARRAFEIAYAAFRLAASMQDPAFSAHLKKEALGLLSASASGEYAQALKCANSLEYIARLGQETGNITIANGKILLAEISRFVDSLNLAATSPEEPNLANFFSHDEGISAILPDLQKDAEPFGKAEESTPLHAKPAKEKYIAVDALPGIRQSGKEVEDELPDVDAEIADEIDGVAVDDETAVDGELFDAGIDTEEDAGSVIVKRHTAILEYVRKNGSCRIKDLQEVLPEVSERTLRYDIRTMIDKGVIERVGAGGPFSFYREREDVPANVLGLQEE